MRFRDYLVMTYFEYDTKALWDMIVAEVREKGEVTAKAKRMYDKLKASAKPDEARQYRQMWTDIKQTAKAARNERMKK